MNTREQSRIMAKHYGLSTGHRWLIITFDETTSVVICVRCGSAGTPHQSDKKTGNCPEYDTSKNIEDAMELVEALGTEVALFLHVDGRCSIMVNTGVAGDSGKPTIMEGEPSDTPALAIHNAAWELLPENVKNDHD